MRTAAYKYVLIMLLLVGEPVFAQGLAVWINVTTYGAKGDGNNDDTNAIQSAINAAAGAGNVVYIPPGIYKTTHTIALASKVWLRGAGIGQTVIQPVPTGNGYPPYNALGQLWYGILTAAGVSHVTISDLTVDLATHQTPTNGIELGYDGSGNVTSYATVMRCEILGAPGAVHQYLIWSHRAIHSQIAHNILNGGESPPGPQEGIEYFGGSDILILANTIQNVSSNGINGFSGDTQGSADGVMISDNYIENSNGGIDLTGDYQGGIPQNLTNATVHSNTIENVKSSGIAITKQPQATVSGISIANNLISTAQDGIHLFSNVSSFDPNWQGISIVGNTVLNVSPGVSGAIFFWAVDDVLFEGNLVNGSTGHGLNVIYCNDLTLVNNQVENVTSSLINLSQVNRVNIKGNYFTNWDVANGVSTGISGSGAKIIVSENSFYRTSGDPYVTALSGDSNQVSFNHLLYDSSRAATDSLGGGTNNNRGELTFSPGTVSSTITNTLVTGDSRILAVQTGGLPKAFTVTQTPGAFTVTLSTTAQGNETFSYEIFQ